MIARPILALAFVGCQVGSSTTGTPEQAASPVVPVVAAVPITPMQMVATDPTVVHEVAAPWTLTASDGSGLQLTRIDAKAVVQGPLAFTELHLYFHNPEDRTREGTFAITLPSGAAVSRFAMEINGQWQEAEVVEKAVARRAYDDFLHLRQDPALLEKAAGNQFSAKVFPIPAKTDKHLVLAFSHELAGRGYTLPLRGLPKTDRVDVQLAATQLDGSNRNQTLSERNWQPDRDFIATVPATAAAVTSGALVVGSLVVASATAAPPDVPKQLTLLVDTSASRALGFASYVKSLRGLIEALRKQHGDPIELQVVAFDQDSQPIFTGIAADYGDAHDKALLARGAAGASDLAQVIATLGAAPKPPHRRVVIVTDGVMTAGPETPALVASIKKLPIDRLDVVLAGGIRDERLAASIVRSGLPRAGDVYDLDRGIQGVALGLGEPVLVDVAIEVPGATWVSPKTVPAARPGSALMVYARMAKPTQTIEVVIGGTRRAIGLGASTPALIERAVAAAEIEELENTLEGVQGDAAGSLRDDIARRSVRARVISSQASMLVLESDADYARYKIDRTALADILVVGPHGIEQTQRSSFLASATPPSRSNDDGVNSRDAARPSGGAPARETVLAAAEKGFASLRGTGDISSGFDDSDIYGGLLGTEAGEIGLGRTGTGVSAGGGMVGSPGLGRYGTIGSGSGTGTGYGVGGGRGGMRGRSANVPTVTIGTPSVTGDLDRAIIRRYIRRNQQKLQYCYEKALLARSALAGTVSTRFVITPTGTVATASGSGVHPEVANCVVAVIKGIEFPAPRGGAVHVSYPIMFRRASDVPDEPVASDPVSSAADEENRGGPPLTGKLADVMKAIRGGNADQALAIARKWHAESPGDVLALVALGESLEAKKDVAAAARIYGSIIDLFSSRADFRRFAGERLERLGPRARKLVIDTYRRAVADRPDHITGHRLLAYALVRDADYAGAFTAILAGLDHKYPDGRFAGADRVIKEDAGMLAAVYLAHGGKRGDVMKELAQRSLELADQPSTRFIMYWETDANDVDFHIRDSRGGHAWYESMELPSGGELYADITTGYGPECFAIKGTPKAGPYRLSINYFSQGPMGYGMGLLQIQRFDGKSLTFDDRPYVIMTDHAFVDLGAF